MQRMDSFTSLCRTVNYYATEQLSAKVSQRHDGIVSNDFMVGFNPLALNFLAVFLGCRVGIFEGL